jgi:hypothetical protein
VLRPASLFVLFSLLPCWISAQVAIAHNLPDTVPALSQKTFTVVIDKGTYSGFASYALRVPGGIDVKSVDAHGAGVASKEGEMVLTWPVVTAKDTLRITFRLETANTLTVYTLQQKFTYVKDDSRQYHTPADITFRVTRSGYASIRGAGEENKEIGQQVMQLRRDAGEAVKVGSAEKKKAKAALEKAMADSASAAANPDAMARDAQLKEAVAARKKASEELATAEKILALATELRSNADQIERISKRTQDAEKEKRTSDSLKSISSTISPARARQQITQMKRDAAEALSVGSAEKKKAEQRLRDAMEDLRLAPEIGDSATRRYAIQKASFEKSTAEADLAVAEKILGLAGMLQANAAEAEKSLPPEKPGANLAPAPRAVEKPVAGKRTTGIPSEGIMHYVQIGAFQNQPDLDVLRRAGELTVVKEDGFYKVLTAGTTDRQQAAEKSRALKGAGFDAFVITYENGIRKK